MEPVKELILAVVVSLLWYTAFLNIEFLYKPLLGLPLALKNIHFTETFVETFTETFRIWYYLVKLWLIKSLIF